MKAFQMNRIKSHSILSVMSFSLVVIIWQWGYELQWIDSFFLPPPSDIISTLINDLKNEDLFLHLKASLFRYVTGTSLGVLSGFLLGIAIALSPLTRALVAPWVTALFAVPKIALLPLFILWLGTGELSKIVILILGSGLPVAIYTWNAIDHTPDVWLLLGKSLHLNKRQTVCHILLPAALPEIFTGLKIASSLGIIILTATEMLGSTHGLGLYIINSGNLALPDRVFAGIILLMLFATTVSGFLQWLEWRLVYWNRTTQ